MDVCPIIRFLTTKRRHCALQFERKNVDVNFLSNDHISITGHVGSNLDCKNIVDKRDARAAP
jgi:hypothetical protein